MIDSLATLARNSKAGGWRLEAGGQELLALALALSLSSISCRTESAQQSPPDAARSETTRQESAQQSPPDAARSEATRQEEAASPDSGSPSLVTVVEGRRQLMGTDFTVSVAGLTETRAREAINAALDAVAEVERRLSPHVPTSDVSRINATAGGDPTQISEATFDLLERARRVSVQSDGAFDVTYAALSPVWRGLRERPPQLPTDAAIDTARALVGYQRLVLDRSQMTASLQTRGMAMNLGGIGKGHGVDLAGEALLSRGVQNFIIGGGGDLLVRGSKQGTPWRLGIQHPRRHGHLMGHLSLEMNGAVVTSGDYERFVEIEGTRYHHIIDPRTGRPARGCASVTLSAQDATVADAMATAVFVLGPVDGMALVEQTEGVEALIIDEHLQVTMSPGLRDIVHLRE